MIVSMIGQGLSSPVVINGLKYGIEGAVAGVAIGVLGTISMVYIASRKDPSVAGVAVFLMMPAAKYGAKYGAIAGAVYGIGKTLLFG